MPRFSCFTRLGHLRFSADPSTAEKIYDARAASLGGDKNFSTEEGALTEAENYAEAMAMARALGSAQRAGQQFRPTKAVEMLPKLESEFGIIPGPKATIRQRQTAVAASAKLSRGARRENVETVLRGLLGEDFIDFVTQDKTTLVQNGLPALTGNWKAPGSPKSVYRITESVSVMLTTLTVPIAHVAGDAGGFLNGDRVILDLEDDNRTETVVVFNCTSTSFDAVFALPHNSGTLVSSGRVPNTSSTKRHSALVLSQSAARDPEKRRVANLALRQLLRGTSTWSIVAEGSGPFKVGPGTGEGLLNFTALHALP